MEDDKVRKIAGFGDRYFKKFLLPRYNTDALTSDWWKALGFFFDHAYYQGRRDGVSEKVQRTATNTFNRLFSPDRDKAYTILQVDGWQTLSEELRKVIGKGKIGKPADIDLTIDSFEYIGKLPSKNIVSFSIQQIKSGKLPDHSNELQHSKSGKNGIRSVGPKIAALYLRDVVSLYNLDSYVSSSDFVLLQPIDTWVRQIALRLGLIVDRNERQEVVCKKIVEACKQAEVSCLKFNQGAWYLGSQSFELVLEELDRII